MSEYRFTKSEKRLFSYGLFAGFNLNANVLSESKLIYLLEFGFLSTSFVQTEEKTKLWIPRISIALSYSF